MCVSRRRSMCLRFFSFLLLVLTVCICLLGLQIASNDVLIQDCDDCSDNPLEEFKFLTISMMLILTSALLLVSSCGCFASQIIRIKPIRCCLIFPGPILMLIISVVVYMQGYIMLYQSWHGKDYLKNEC